MASRKKDTDHRLERIADVAADTRPIIWLPTPAWAIGGDVDVLFPDRGVDLSTITKATYLTALERAGYPPEQHGPSWARFVAFREGEHGLGCDCCPACIAKRPPPPPPTPSESRMLDSLDEYGLPRHPQDRETPTPSARWQAEQQRLARVANSVPVRYF